MARTAKYYTEQAEKHWEEARTRSCEAQAGGSSEDFFAKMKLFKEAARKAVRCEEKALEAKG